MSPQVDPQLRSTLPPALAATLESSEFLTMVISNFDAIDVDKNNSLSPAELAPGILVMLAGMQGGGEATQATEDQVRTVGLERVPILSRITYSTQLNSTHFQP